MLSRNEDEYFIEKSRDRWNSKEINKIKTFCYFYQKMKTLRFFINIKNSPIRYKNVNKSYEFVSKRSGPFLVADDPLRIAKISQKILKISKKFSKNSPTFGNTVSLRKLYLLGNWVLVILP